jgi:hypothetical protein
MTPGSTSGHAGAGAGALAGLGILVPGLRAPDTAAAAPEPVSLRPRVRDTR